MKIIITLLALLNGSYMLLDGIFVMVKGKYIGPAKPGPWANLFYKMNLNVFNLGWLFVVYGLVWLIWVYALSTSQTWAYPLGLMIGVLTIWYLPFGTLISFIVLATLLFGKHTIGL